MTIHYLIKNLNWYWLFTMQKNTHQVFLIFKIQLEKKNSLFKRTIE